MVMGVAAGVNHVLNLKLTLPICVVAHSSVCYSGGRRGCNRGEVHKTRLRGDENNVLEHVLLNLLPVL